MKIIATSELDDKVKKEVKTPDPSNALEIIMGTQNVANSGTNRNNPQGR